MPTAPLCRHIRMSGKPCRALALKDQGFCYNHDKTFLERREARRTAPTRRPPTADLLFQLSNIDDFAIIQQAICAIIGGFTEEKLGRRRANPMLHALAVASRNAAARPFDPNRLPSSGQDAEAIISLILAKPARPARPEVS